MTDQPPEHYDIIGDVHGCFDEFTSLLTKLGYTLSGPADQFGAHALSWSGAGPKRRIVFVGDLVDRGPASLQMMKTAMRAVREGLALAVLGNHDDKLRRWLLGNPVTVKHGLEITVEEFANTDRAIREAVCDFLDELPELLRLDSGCLIITHASYREDLHELSPKHRRKLCLYGPSTGRFDEYGLPERIDWAPGYSGQAYVVYGHTPVKEPRWCGRSVNVDTGCVFGGSLTALRYPEMTTVSVASNAQYAQSRRAFV